MNKKNLIQNYGLWILLLCAYAGFILLKNHAWIEEDQITAGDLLTPMRETINVPSENPPDTTLAEAPSAGIPDTLPPNLKNQAPVLRSESSKPSPTLPKKTYRPAPIDINKANQKEWETLRGIGDYRSGMIIRFRSALGGFHSIDQVADTYGLPDSVFSQIRPFLRMKTPPKKLYINTLPYDRLHQHPYITKQMAYFIARHREKEGHIEKVEQLYEIIEEKDHKRLKNLEPYVDFSIR